MTKNIKLVKKKLCLNDVWIEINSNKPVGSTKRITSLRSLEDGSLPQVFNTRSRFSILRTSDPSSVNKSNTALNSSKKRLINIMNTIAKTENEDYVIDQLQIRCFDTYHSWNEDAKGFYHRSAHRLDLPCPRYKLYVSYVKIFH